MSAKEHLYLFLLIFKQEKLFGRAREGNLGSRRIFSTVLAGHKKKLFAGRYLPTPGIYPSSFVLPILFSLSLIMHIQSTPV
jgi:hypothetical protein